MADPHLIGLTIGRRIAELQKGSATIPSKPRLPSIGRGTTPVVPVINVQPSEALAPIINIETVAPIINVQPSAPTINVEAATPAINIETVAPIINVETNAPIINIETVAPIVNVQAGASPVVNVTTPEVRVENAAPIINVPESVVNITTPEITVSVPAPVVNVAPPEIKVEVPAPIVNVTTPQVVVNFDVKPIASALIILADAVKSNRSEIQKLQIEISGQADAISTLAKAMLEPRTLLFKDGKPIGIKIGK